MEDVKVNMVPITDLRSPPILYKYRDWNVSFHKKLIFEPSIYLSAPSDFEDPIDCKNPIRYDLLTDFEIFDKYFRESINKNNRFDYFHHFEWAGNWFLKNPLRDPIQVNLIETEALIEFNERFGVLSLTADPLNKLMWEKYGNKNKGFCIGYDGKLLFDFLGGGSEVIYRDCLPIIKPFGDLMLQHHKQVFYKEMKWFFEKEYRTHKSWPYRITKDVRNVIIAKKCIVEVIFGTEMPNAHRLEIENYLYMNLPHVKIIKTMIDGDEIKFCT